jgi:predicted dehydrogenase
MYPDGIGRKKHSPPPSGLDWEMWLGPRAYRPYQANITPYKFRWWKDYSTQMGNWGVHYMDVIRWLLGEEAPVAITAHGSKNLVDDDRTIPDTMEVTFEFASGGIVVFGIYEACGGPSVPHGEIELRGGAGTLWPRQSGYRIEAARPGQFQSWEALTEEADVEFEDTGDSTANLIRNFLDCVKSRETPWCTLEDGHRSTSFAHLANISLEVDKRIEWDPGAERATNCDKANELLHYNYREPWVLP